jgi:hypothetical protein
LLVFPDDIDAMTVSPANCACPSRSTACGERGPAGAPQAIAKIYVIREDFKRAEYWFQKAIAGDPRHIDAMIHYGQPRLLSTRYRWRSPATPASAAPDLPHARAGKLLGGELEDDRLAAMVFSRTLEYARSPRPRAAPAGAPDAGPQRRWAPRWACGRGR